MSVELPVFVAPRVSAAFLDAPGALLGLRELLDVVPPPRVSHAITLGWRRWPM